MNRILYLIATLLILTGLFFVLNPKSSRNINLSPAPIVPVVKTFDLVVKNNKLAKGSDNLKVNQGENVVIRITADVDGELHLHGYDKSVNFKKDKQAQLSFTAKLSGRFPYELENTKTEIGALEVQPK